MSRKYTKINSKQSKVLELVNENDVTNMVGHAVASVMLNPVVTWAKFILTDDLPNGNNMRIPFEEFDNIIKTGVHMPVKMTEGSIENHAGAAPLGVITHIKKETAPDGHHQLIALAALWGAERPADIEYIRKVMQDVGEVNVSWEVVFGNREISSGGVQTLKDVILKAVTIVKNPAYQGRTRFLAIAGKAEAWSPAYIEDLPDSSFLYVAEKPILEGQPPQKIRLFPIKDENGLISLERLNVVLSEVDDSDLSEESKEGVRLQIQKYLEELNSGMALEDVSELEEPPKKSEMEEKELKTLEELQAQLNDAETQLTQAQSELDEKQKVIKELEEKVKAFESEKAAMSSELNELREFKKSIEEEITRKSRLDEIKAKFAEAGLEKDDEYFNQNANHFLNLGDSDIEFLIQEMAAFAKMAEASLKEAVSAIPNIKLEKLQLGPKELANALKKQKSK